MIVRAVTATLAALLFAAGTAWAASPTPAPTPTLDPHPQGAETAFVGGIQKDLTARFATTADAVKAGYFRYGDEDETGAISYANLHWQSTDPQHPSQLWYDAKGHLLGADFSILQSKSPKAPDVWGVNPRRWFLFPAHIHFIVKTANGVTYGYAMPKKWVAEGGSLDRPTAITVVKMGKAPDQTKVTKVFLFPAVWDLIVWVKDNPNGAFAEKNPNVIPSANAGSSM